MLDSSSVPPVWKMFGVKKGPWNKLLDDKCDIVVLGGFVAIIVLKTTILLFHLFGRKSLVYFRWRCIIFWCYCKNWNKNMCLIPGISNKWRKFIYNLQSECVTNFQHSTFNQHSKMSFLFEQLLWNCWEQSDSSFYHSLNYYETETIVSN